MRLGNREWGVGSREHTTGDRNQGIEEKGPRGTSLPYSLLPIPHSPLRAKRGACTSGFTLIELIIVVSIVLILIAIAAPIYRTSIIRSKEAVLRDDLFTMRSLIDQYTVDKQAAPQSLADLVTEGYLREIPVDPFTNSSQTWQEIFESDVIMNPDQTTPGLTDVRSGSSLRSLNGNLYSEW